MNVLPDEVRETVKLWTRLALTEQHDELTQRIMAAERANTKTWQIAMEALRGLRETPESREIDALRAEVKAELEKEKS